MINVFKHTDTPLIRFPVVQNLLATLSNIKKIIIDRSTDKNDKN